MKKIFFLFAMLTISITANAQTGVTVTPVSAKSSTVTFNVSWLNNSRTGTYSSKVWVFVDYRTIVNNAPSGGWTRALVSGTPTATSGTLSLETGNDKGFWLQGTSGNSGTYNATITVTLSNVPTKFNWCAYVSDYPPNVTLDKGTYTFKGTANFIVNSHAQPLITNTIAKASLTVNSSSTFTDATGCPGIGSLYCPYTGSDLYMDATHLCQKRTTGAQNWEAYIKDSRDDQIYRITQFSDNTWWFAEYLAIADKRVAVCGGKSLYLGTNKPSCPTGWTIPTWDEFYNRWKPNICTVWPPTADNYGGTLEGSCRCYTQSVCGGTNPNCTPNLTIDVLLNNGVNTVFIYSAGCTWNGCTAGVAGTANTDARQPGIIRCKR
ncbi:MAG: hypothetical protein LBU42_01145 [Prevotellaceae bacterium]|jgi:hypothetical protein|nr:hypothetical protein [Prevotellaceae bacterium]